MLGSRAGMPSTLADIFASAVSTRVPGTPSIFGSAVRVCTLVQACRGYVCQCSKCVHPCSMLSFHRQVWYSFWYSFWGCVLASVGLANGRERCGCQRCFLMCTETPTHVHTRSCVVCARTCVGWGGVGGMCACMCTEGDSFLCCAIY